MNRPRVWLSAVLLLVTAVIFGICISRNPIKSKIFVPTHEYRLVPDDAVIPRGLDIKIDMQTGEKWVRLAQKKDADEMVFVKEGLVKDDDGKVLVKNSDKSASSSQAPAYSNTSNKWKGRFQSVSAAIEQTLGELEFEVSRENAYELLEEEASALEVGAGILHSSKFAYLRKLLVDDHKAMNILNICLQNNPPAVFKAVELGLFQNEIVSLLKKVNDSITLKRLLQVLNSFLIHGDDSEPVAEIVAMFKSHKILANLTEAINRINLSLTERQLVVLLRISFAVNEDLSSKFTSHLEYPSALLKHCESYPKCKLCQ